jgi:hypothetical protein
MMRARCYPPMPVVRVDTYADDSTQARLVYDGARSPSGASVRGPDGTATNSVSLCALNGLLLEAGMGSTCAHSRSALLTVSEDRMLLGSSD